MSHSSPGADVFWNSVSGYGFDPTLTFGPSATFSESYGQPPELVKHGAASPIGS